MAIKRIKKNISLQQETLNLGQEKANLMFNGNFSMYVTYLINKDCKLIKTMEEKKEIKKEVIDEKVKDTMDSILNM